MPTLNWKLRKSAGYNSTSNPPVFRVNLAEMTELDMELLKDTINSAELEIGITQAASTSGSQADQNGPACPVELPKN